MTVHGAKGLEADVVFLADTGGAAVVHQQRDTLVDIGSGRDDPAFLWRRNKAEAPELQRDADAREDRETEAEYLRLLYVAMTRARDVLYVAGMRLLKDAGATAGTRSSRDALVPTDAERDEEGELAAPYLWPQPCAAAAAAAAKRKRRKRPRRPRRPPWLFRAAPSPAPAPQPLRPSRGLAEPDPIPAAAAEMAEAAPGDAALLRGRVVHLLLELLPGLPADARRAAAERLLAREVPDDPDLAASILAEAEAVLADAGARRAFRAGKPRGAGDRRPCRHRGGRLCGERPHRPARSATPPAGTSSISRPTAPFPPRRRRPTPAISCSSRSTGGC